MLASNPMSGLSLRAMIERAVSFKNCVFGEGESSALASGSASYCNRSKRFAGLESAARPLMGTRASLVGEGEHPGRESGAAFRFGLRADGHRAFNGRLDVVWLL